jgi:predicted amino acid dehydrogenase
VGGMSMTTGDAKATPLEFAYILHLLDHDRMVRHEGGRYGLLPYAFARSHMFKRLARLGETYGFEVLPRRRVCIRSPLGSICHGNIVLILMSPAEIMAQPSRALDLILRACRKARSQGAEIIGLGGLAAVVGGMGRSVQDAMDVPITTGNSYTACAALATFERARQSLGGDFPPDPPVVLGGAGGIAACIAEALAEQGHAPILVGPPAKPLRSLVELLRSRYGAQVEICPDVQPALERSRVVFGASSTGGKIEQRQLRPGSVVIDVAQPRDVVGDEPLRDDVLILDGEIVSLPASNQPPFDFFRLGANRTYACLGELILLALEGRRESFSLGKKLDLRRIREIGALADRHGFGPTDFFSFDKPLPPAALDRFRRTSSDAWSGTPRGHPGHFQGVRP